MSSALALAAVTECLKEFLNESLNEVSTAIGDYRISSLAPDLIDPSKIEKDQLNVFLYQITPNGALHNADLPTRSSQGEQICCPVLAVDLHYLITAYSKHESHAEIMLGQAAQMFYSRPVLTRENIKKKEEDWINGTDQYLKEISGSGLSAQIELVRFAPQSLNSEEVSKLWAAIQTHYRPTVAYQASVILLCEKGPTRAALPVLTIGPGDSGVLALPELVPPLPLLTEAVFPQQEVTAILDDVLLLKGHHLDGDNVVVRFSSQKIKKRLEISQGQNQTPTEVSAKLLKAKDCDRPADPPQKTWSVGHYSTVVLVQRRGESYQRTTNTLVLTLAPKIKALTLTNVGGILEAQVNCEPEVLPEQETFLIIGDWSIAAKPHAAQTDQLVFETRLPGHIKSGEEHTCRLLVDGVESHFIDRTKTPLAFDTAARKRIP